jgi:NAD(P)-dependent dehydrogenase (short-subunit alcohol dehydrogenase family)
MSGPKSPSLIDMKSKRVIITGANSGLGKESAIALAKLGAEIVLAVRDINKGQSVKNQILNQTPSAVIEVAELDLMDLDSVRKFAASQSTKPIDVLLNNAGIMAVPFEKTKDGFESQMGTNHLGHFLLTELLLDAISKGTNPRIVNVSSSAHRLGKLKTGDKSEINVSKENYSPWTVYGNSKLANLLFTNELVRRLKIVNSNITVAVAHPGYANTNLQLVAATKRSGLRKSVELAVTKVMNIILGQSAAKGALPQIAACTWVDIQSGDYLGPRGLFESRGKPKKVKMNKSAQDIELAKRVWRTSEELLGVTFLHG